MKRNSMSTEPRRKALLSKFVIYALALAALVAFSSISLAQSTPETQTFSNPTPIQIPDSGPASPYPSTIEVAGFEESCLINDVNVTLHNLTHTYPDDIYVLLVAPGGENALIMGAAGGSFPADNVTLILDDEAPTPLPDDAPLVSGSYQPANYGAPDPFPPPAPAPSGATALSVFDGTNPNGTWQLFVVDAVGGDQGAFAGGWSLEITVACGEAAPTKQKQQQGGAGAPITQEGEQESEAGEIDQSFEVS